MAYRIAVIIFAVSLLFVCFAASERTYVAGRFAIELDGINAGWLKSADGGHATADVIEEPFIPGNLPLKHIGGVKWEDISVSCSTGMSKGFYEWVKASFDGKPLRKDGALIAADYEYKEKSRVDYHNGLITEIGFPALDGSSKEPAYMKVKVSPEATKFGPGTGQILKPGAPFQKKWLPSNFRLEIDGLDCSKVNKIESLTVKQGVAEGRLGQLEPTKLEFPNLSISLAESSAKTFYDWHEDFVIKGNNGQDKEKGGTLEYLTPDLKEVLFTLTFKNLGIFKCTPEKVEAGSENIRRVKAEMYCEDIKFTYGAGVIGQ